MIKDRAYCVMVLGVLAMLFSFVHAMTFEEYIAQRGTESVDGYLIGYSNAVHDNVYFFGGCARQVEYRPYGEYRAALDAYIADQLHSEKVTIEEFYVTPVEPIFTGIVMSYLNCDMPRSLKAEGVRNMKVIKMVRDVARLNLKRTPDVMDSEEISDKKKLVQCSADLASIKHKIAVQSEKKTTKKKPEALPMMLNPQAVIGAAPAPSPMPSAGVQAPPPPSIPAAQNVVPPPPPAQRESVIKSLMGVAANQPSPAPAVQTPPPQPSSQKLPPVPQPIITPAPASDAPAPVTPAANIQTPSPAPASTNEPVKKKREIKSLDFS